MNSIMFYSFDNRITYFILSMTIRRYFWLYKASTLCLALCASNYCAAFFYQKFEPYRKVPFTEWFIQQQEPFFEQWRSMSFLDLERRDEYYEGADHHYLFRPGETSGVVILFHGVLARKEFYFRLVKALIKRGKPLPTLLIPDLPGAWQPTLSCGSGFFGETFYALYGGVYPLYP